MGIAEGILKTCVVLVSTVFCVFGYKMPNLTMEAKYPAGFRVFIPDQRGIEEFGFNANINEPLESYEAGEISAEVKGKTGQFWIYQDDDIGLEPGDSLYYWTYVVFRGVVYKKTRQKWVCINFVREFSNITLPRRPPKMPPFYHPFRPFVPPFPWLNTTTKPPLPTATTKRSVTTATSTSPPLSSSSSPPPQPTTAATTASPTTTTAPTTVTTRVPEPETTTTQPTTKVITTTAVPEPETTTAEVTTPPPTIPEVVTTTKIPEPETTTAPPTTPEVTTTGAPEPETTTAQATTVVVPEVTTTSAPETTTAPEVITTSAPEVTTVLDIVPEVISTGAPTAAPEISVTSGLPEVTPDFCNETVPTAPTTDFTPTPVDVTPAQPYAPPVYWPSNREDCLNVWSPSYRPFMSTLKITKSVILLECQAMSQKRKMTRVRTELFNLSKFNYEMESRLEALEKRVFADPKAVASHEEEMD